MKSLLLILFIPFAKEIPYRTLTWSDFKGKPDKSTTIARSYTGIIIEKDTAFAYFDVERSWTRTNDEAVLWHEQIHFAITKMWAMRISNSLIYGSLFVADYLKEWGKMEEAYDEETDHGNNLEKQKEWEEKIKL
jgi:hypothetical protein